MDVLVSGYVGTYDKMLELSGNHTSFQTIVYENRLLVNPRSAKTGVLVRYVLVHPCRKSSDRLPGLYPFLRSH